MSDQDPARETALRMLRNIDEKGTTTAELFANLSTTDLDQRDRNFIRQLVLGIQRWRQRLDWIVDQFAHHPIASASPWSRQILRIGVYQLLWLDRVPPRAVLHTSVELAKRYQHNAAASFVNAILRQVLHCSKEVVYPSVKDNPVAYLAVYHSHPHWLVERWLNRWGLATAECLLRANNTTAPLYIRTNRRRVTPAILRNLLFAAGWSLHDADDREGCFAVESPSGLFESAPYRAGLFQVQDINAGLPVALLSPRPGEKILDLCSGPGGKATQIAEALGDTGIVAASDRVHSRVRRVRENAHRLGLSQVLTFVADARLSGPGNFDRVLADVPCANTGVLGRHPEARWNKSANQLVDLVEIQQQILHRAFESLRPGGVLVYSTCSLEPEENEAPVRQFLASGPPAQLEDARRLFPRKAWAGDFIQTLPGRDPGDGCFAARIRKLTV